jgi:predicted nucleic acid-binding protein
MKRLFVDANVILEILLSRRLAPQCTTLLKDVSQQYAISALTVHIVWYMAEKYNLDQNKVDDVLAGWEILPITTTGVALARLRYGNKDFEDCLQAASAEEGNCDQIITIDKEFKKYSRTALPIKIVG